MYTRCAEVIRGTASFGDALTRDKLSRVHLVVSENALRVIAEELGIAARNDLVEKLLSSKTRKRVYGRDYGTVAPTIGPSRVVDRV